MGKQKNKRKRKAVYREWMMKNAPAVNGSGEYCLLSCKRHPERMAINYKRGLRPQEKPSWRDLFEDG